MTEEHPIGINKDFWTPERFAKVLKDGRLFFKAVTALNPYDWQVKFIENESTFESLRVSRQGGKSITAAVKIVREVLLHGNQFVIITSPTRQQSMVIFRQVSRILNELALIAPGIIKQVLATQAHLANESWVMVFSRTAVRGPTATRIVIDEAAYVENEVFVAIRPTLAASGGKLTLISTPYGKQGYFYESHTSLEHFYRVHVPCTEVPHLSKEFLESERVTMTEAEYAQEYLAEFIETADNFFTREEVRSIIGDVVPLGAEPNINLLDWDKFYYYLGVDLARYGTDESTYVVVRAPKDGQGSIEVVHIEGTSKKPVTDAIGRIKALHNTYKFRNIYIDESVIGGGVVDELTINHKIPVVPIMFSSKEKNSIKDTKKEAMYKNLKWLLEQNVLAAKEGATPYLQSYMHQKLLNQMTSLIYEFSSSGVLKVHHPEGGHDDYTDALALALYFCAGRKYAPLVSSVSQRRREEDKAREESIHTTVQKTQTWEDKLKYLRKIG